jgi:Outer membrane protein beta-barrel domain
MPGQVGAALSTRATWDASARGRAGYLITPWTLVYITGGPAWLHIESTATCGIAICGGPGVAFNNSSNRLGWTLGGGIETRLWGSWFGRAEYRYSDYGDVTYTNANAALGITATYDERIRTHIALFGLAYKFGDVPGYAGSQAPFVAAAAVFPTKAPLAADPGNWSGAYAGLDRRARGHDECDAKRGHHQRGGGAVRFCNFPGGVRQFGAHEYDRFPHRRSPRLRLAIRTDLGCRSRGRLWLGRPNRDIRRQPVARRH